MLLCWLPAQVGAVSDFARVGKLGEAVTTDFVEQRHADGEVGLRAAEGASRSSARHGQRSSRQTRTPTETFATEPSNEPYSFQVISLHLFQCIQ